MACSLPPSKSHAKASVCPAKAVDSLLAIEMFSKARASQQVHLQSEKPSANAREAVRGRAGEGGSSAGPALPL